MSCNIETLSYSQTYFHFPICLLQIADFHCWQLVFLAIKMKTLCAYTITHYSHFICNQIISCKLSNLHRLQYQFNRRCHVEDSSFSVCDSEKYHWNFVSASFQLMFFLYWLFYNAEGVWNLLLYNEVNVSFSFISFFAKTFKTLLLHVFLTSVLEQINVTFLWQKNWELCCQEMISWYQEFGGNTSLKYFIPFLQWWQEVEIFILKPEAICCSHSPRVCTSSCCQQNEVGYGGRKGKQ